MAGRIHKEPFAQIPEWLLRSAVSDRAVRAFGLLDRHADKEGRAFPGRPKLAIALDCSTSSLDRALDELRDVGALVTTERFREDGSRSSNDYWLWPANPEKSSWVDTPLITGDEGGLVVADEGVSSPMTRQEREPEEREPEVTTPLAQTELIARAFALFWEIWPDKRDKGAARKAWGRALKAAQSPAPILEGARRFAQDPNLPTVASGFMPHASTWLNGERWNDPPLAPRAKVVNGRQAKEAGTLDALASLLPEDKREIG